MEAEGQGFFLLRPATSALVSCFCHLASNKGYGLWWSLLFLRQGLTYHKLVSNLVYTQG